MSSSTKISSDSLDALGNHGERMVPEYSDGRTFWEHVYRYAFACRLVRGKKVLDVACGEGYGSAALQRAGASSVIGVDINEGVCLHARVKYQLDVRVGSAESLPVSDRSVDVVVSFETIEHVPNPSRFLEECARVLIPGGKLVVSTPNKNIYSGPGRASNPHHCSEMTEGEFVAALRSQFRSVRIYTQRPMTAAVWSPRIFAAEAIPPVRGIGRLRRSARFRLFPRAVCDPTASDRTSAVDLILSASRSGDNMLNPHAVRPKKSWHRETPMYLIAVATG
ncbi:MAG: class I SAM-dependent methyltransferase [Candidatus Acidiferrales bacterium]